jgi:hypothetical protein
MVYAAFMNSTKHHSFPIVDASFDHGKTFPQVSALVPRKRNNWGDRDFITVAPDGTLYLTWDYGPSAKKVTFICPHSGSCAFATGDLNVVLQRSTDGARPGDPSSMSAPASRPVAGTARRCWSSPVAGSTWSTRATASTTTPRTR